MNMLLGYEINFVVCARDKLHDLCTEYEIYFCYYNFVHLVHTLHVAALFFVCHNTTIVDY